jgi:hypothetical protein
MKGFLSVWAMTITIVLAAGELEAQSIAGSVRDTSGAILPGVTVEATSPALIERARSVTTDGSGQYKIVSLSPGTYTVTFVLPGFSSVRRDGIELTTDFTANVNAELKVGAVEETITVSGATPLVDIQAVSKQMVITRDVIDALPTAHSIQAAGVLIPGVTSTGAGLTGGGRDVGGNTMLQQPTLSFRGSTSSLQYFDGMWMSNLTGTGVGGAISLYVNDAGAQELTYQTGADTLEIPAPGMAVNMIPKDGGNSFRGVLFSDLTYEPWSASNLTDGLRSRGLTNVSKVHHISDVNGGAGGPLAKDKLWFYGAYRYQVLNSTIVDSFYDLNPLPYVYEPDLTRPGYDDGKIPNASFRMTWQASSKDKVAGWITDQHKQRYHFALITGIVPDALAIQKTPVARGSVIKWTRTQTNKLLFEVGVGDEHNLYKELYRPEVTPLTYAITDQANGKCFNAYCPGYSEHHANMQDYKGGVTYVTGSHAIRGGMLLQKGVTNVPQSYTGDLTMTFNNGAPQSVTLRIPVNPFEAYFPDLALYAQDRWTFKRATITAGARYDYYVGKTLPGTLPSSRWNPSQTFDGSEVQHWKDFSPRVGIAYDLAGNGKTALKANISRYLAPDGTATAAANNPQRAIGITDTRTWRDLNGDFTIYNADGSLQTAELGPTGNANFGKVIPTTTTTDPRTLNGWNARGTTLEWQALIQHQVTSRVAVSGGYFFRWIGNQLVTDNTLITAADFDGPFCVAAPSSPQLPGGGGYQVCGLYDIKAASRALVQNNRTLARNFGGVVDHFMGYDFAVNARLRAGTFINAGVNGLRRVNDTCNAPALAGTNQVDSPEAQFCHTVTPYRPDLKLNGSHTFPHNILVSATYQLSPGPNITASWAAPNSAVLAALGRSLSAGATATKTISLIEPGKDYESYLNELDLRLSKRVTLGRYKLRGDLNLYNVFNNAFITSINTTFSTTASNQYLRPNALLQGRLFKIGGQLEF